MQEIGRYSDIELFSKFICDLLNEFSVARIMWRWKRRLMNNELEMMWKKMVVELRILKMYMEGWRQTLRLGQDTISGRRFKPATSRVWNGIAMFRPFPSAYLIDLSISWGLHSTEHWMHSSDASGACKHHAQRTRPEPIAKCSRFTRVARLFGAAR